MRRVSSIAALLAASLAVAFTAACGGGSDGSDGGGQTDNGGGNNAFAAYIECMQKNGVTVAMASGGARGDGRPSGSALPDGERPSFPAGEMPSGMPRPEGSGFPDDGGFPGGGMGMQKPEGVDDATWEKAQSACASVRPTGFDGRGGPGGNGANAAYLNCLRDNGVTNTDNLDTTDDAVKKAVETCQVLRPQASANPTS